MIKSTMLFFIKIANEYKARCFILVLYSIFAGYVISLWPVLIKQVYINQTARISLIIIFITHFSYDFIKEVILFPVYNQASYQLKLYNINNAHQMNLSDVNSGKFISNLQRTTSGKYIFKSFISIFKNGALVINNLYLIFFYNHIFATIILFILLVYILIIVFLNKHYIFLKKKAWQSSEKVGDSLKETIDQTIAIRQAFVENTSYNFTYKELLSWNNYYLKSNIYFAMLSLFYVLIIYISFLFKSEITIIFLSWNLSNGLKALNNNMKTIVSTSADISVFLTQKKHTVQPNRLYTKGNIDFDNVMIHNKLGPFNFHTQKRLIGLKGQNGVGKTQLSLAIAGLIPFKGFIGAPKALYISLKNEDNIKTVSNGENAMKILDKAFKSDFDMIIIDELLDVLSYINLNECIQKLLNIEKTIILISHQDNILQNMEEIFELGVA